MYSLATNAYYNKSCFVSMLVSLMNYIRLTFGYFYSAKLQQI